MIFREDCGYVRSPRVAVLDDPFVRAARLLCGLSNDFDVLSLYDSMYGYRIDTTTAAREELAREVRFILGITVDMEEGDRALLRVLLGVNEAFDDYRYVKALVGDTPVPLTTNGASHEQEEGSSQGSRAEGAHG